MTSPARSLPFSKVRIAKGLAFLPGELPQGDDGSLPEGIEAQTELALRRISATLAGVLLDMSDVVQVTVYLTEMAEFGDFYEIYHRHFADPLPVRATVLAQLVVPAARVVVAAVAATRD